MLTAIKLERKVLEDLKISPIINIKRIEADDGKSFEVTRQAVICGHCSLIQFLKPFCCSLHWAQCLDCNNKFQFFSALDWRIEDRIKKHCVRTLYEGIVAEQEVFQKGWADQPVDLIPATGYFCMATPNGSNPDFMFFMWNGDDVIEVS